ncbi:MAG TPA: hypothetical protein VM094_02495 [Gemmatimonadales bacterium]|nr:hypothetical protein [Gemmatimonadales bacterium]
MIQPGAQHRRGPAVVLRRAQHDDGIHRAPLIVLASHQHRGERDGVDDRGHQEHQARDRAQHAAARH